MDVFEAVESRIACRHFFDKPVDLNIVKELIKKAARAASGGNLQSWNVYALTGKPLADFKAVVQKRIAEKDPRHSKTEYQVYPEPMFGAYAERREAHGVQLYGSLGIDRSDPVARGAQFNKNFEFFSAPVALFITIDRKLGPGQWADLGGYIATIAVLARGYGLDTCPQEAWARLYDTVTDFLKIPANEMLFCGMAIGYGDRKHKANDFHSPRAELHEFCKFYGFD
jgi:nitroreductase